MNSSKQIDRLETRKFLGVILGIQLAMLGLIGLALLGLDIPVLRQIVGFVYLIFIPGFIILSLLRLNKLGLVEKFVLTMGLSIAFLMFAGLAFDQTLFALGYATPLSTIPLMIFLGTILFILTIVSYKVNKQAFSFNLFNFKLNTKEKAFLLLPLFFPFLSIFGVYLMNTANNNMMLMALLFLIPAYVILMVILRHQVPERTYAPVIFLISISLVLMPLLRSSHIMGSDAHNSYQLFQLISHEGHWQLFEKGLLNSCLSVTLLPTIYQSVLNMDSAYLFKMLSVLPAISPLVVYILSKKYIGSSWAFLASFFFMSQIRFVMTGGGPRTIIAILFFALIIMALFHDGISGFAKQVLFIVFAASAIVSHYSIAYIFLFILLLTWAGTRIIPKVVTHGGTVLRVPQSRLKKRVTIATVALFFAMLFLWYGQVTEVPFSASVNFISHTFANLNLFFVMESRGELVSQAFAADITGKEISQNIAYFSSWLTVTFIAIGVLYTLARYRHRVTFSGREEGLSSEFLSRRIDAEFLILSLISSAVLATAVALPYIFVGYGFDRAYFQMMAVLSPFCVIGGILLAKFLRAKPSWILLVVLIPYFLANTGAIPQISGAPRSLTLNSAGYEYNLYHIHDQEIYAARWLGDYGDLGRETSPITTDAAGWSRLLYGGVSHSISSRAFFDPDKEIKGYIYLRYYNVMNGKLLDSEYGNRDLVEYQEIFIGKSKIYTNGGSEIWR